ncbi:hypothetical protein [Microbacterium dextranolyticum]|uniref:Uncharacterized protein n=1 Tax=Microbacterium dextranolyticum TaxID=36806 RepID=A0A9W6HLJ8_9MICO|nr:hypothetical protein [Microbacterium dextranolyticum]MBM7463478.1 type II secretory pathway pseudopilin PulG [Microbacterium dextranolyticum]GLJ95421.1 hypothetical protein GCM10017591_14840 [Microbacterium dextranolyticum]
MDWLAASGVVATLLAAAATVWAVVYQQRSAATRVQHSLEQSRLSLEQSRQQLDVYQAMVIRYVLETTAPDAQAASFEQSEAAATPAAYEPQSHPFSAAELAQYKQDIQELAQINGRAAMLHGLELAAFLEMHRHVRDRVEMFLDRAESASTG